MKKININIPNNEDIEIESKTPLTDEFKRLFGNDQSFIILNEEYREETLEFIEDYRDCKIFKAVDGMVVTREAERYIVHYDIANLTWEGKLAAVKKSIDENRDRRL